MDQLDTIIKKVVEDVGRAAADAARAGRFVPEYLDTREAAAYLGLSTQFLEIGRSRGYGPKFHKLAKAVRYKRSDLDAWMAQHSVQPPGGKSAA